jgi:hypothetical protein
VSWTSSLVNFGSWTGIAWGGVGRDVNNELKEGILSGACIMAKVQAPSKSLLSFNGGNPTLSCKTGSFLKGLRLSIGKRAPTIAHRGVLPFLNFRGRPSPIKFFRDTRCPEQRTVYEGWDTACENP